MLVFLICIGILLIVFDIYVIVTQVLKDKSLSKYEKNVWSITLIALPLYGLWMWNHRKSKMKNKNILRF
jgi:cadmium resistance protein CadD (predicted permease)